LKNDLDGYKHQSEGAILQSEAKNAPRNFFSPLANITRWDHWFLVTGFAVITFFSTTVLPQKPLGRQVA